MKKHKELTFFIILFGIVLFLFRNAFTMGFFQDDFFFLRISKIGSLGEFIGFFNPIRDVFYRPISSEAFYSFLHAIGLNIVFGRLFVLLFFFGGLIFLYKIIHYFFGELVAMVTTFMYAIHFTHVFQLYWFATFQEIALFTFCTVALYFWIVNKKKLSIFFYICALLSKETALLLTFLIVGYDLCFVYKKQKRLYIKKEIIILGLITILALLIYKIGGSTVATLENYRIQFDPKLVINNFAWYFMWSFGFPNFMPVYSASLFRPLPEFWNIISQDPYRLYFYPMIVFNVLIFFSTFVQGIFKRTDKKFIYVVLMSLFIFFLFIIPSLFIIHRWMVRLTLPLVGISLIYGWILVQMIQNRRKKIRLIGLISLIIYTLWNFYGIQVHESSGLFNQEKTIYTNAKRIFNQKRSAIEKTGKIYFIDAQKNDLNPMSKTLMNSFHDQDIADYFFPSKKIQIYYDSNIDFEPKDVVIIPSEQLFK